MRRVRNEFGIFLREIKTNAYCAYGGSFEHVVRRTALSVASGNALTAKTVRPESCVGTALLPVHRTASLSGPSPVRPLYRVTNQVWTFDCVTKSRRTISLSRGSFNRRFLFGESLRRPNSRTTSHVFVSSHATLPARPSARRTTRTRPPRPRFACVPCTGGEKKKVTPKSLGSAESLENTVYLKSLRITKTYEKKCISFVNSANRENRHGGLVKRPSSKVVHRKNVRDVVVVSGDSKPHFSENNVQTIFGPRRDGRTGGPKTSNL